MNLAHAAGVDLTDAAEITLGGVAFLVPKLVFRQTQHIRGRAGAVLHALNRNVPERLFASLPRGEDGKPIITDDDALALTGKVMLTEEENEHAIRILHAGVLRAHPHVTLNDLLDLPIENVEIVRGVRVVLEKAGVIRSAGDEPQGEA